MRPIVIGVPPRDNRLRLAAGCETSQQSCTPESSTKPEQSARKIRATKNRLLAMAPAAFTIKNQGRWRIRTCRATGCASQILDVTIPSVR
jgi:hypothetical protein